MIRLGRASLTAELVALWRARADAGATHVPGFRDPVARAMLGAATASLLRVPVWPVAALEVIPLRVTTFDAMLTAALQRGVRQVVTLGAGFDTRPWRLPELAPARVFEVDFPATQAAKRERTAGLPVLAGEVSFVPVDFERQALGRALEEAGHDAHTPTAWIWEGVVMYLTDEPLRATLAAVRERSAANSRLLVHYHTPDPPGAISRARHALFRALFEPHVGLREPQVMRAELEAAGFRVLSDRDAQEQAHALGAPMVLGPRERTSRVAEADPA